MEMYRHLKMLSESSKKESVHFIKAQTGSSSYHQLLYIGHFVSVL